MTAILEDKASPLFNRVSHKINLDHWDFQTLLEMFDRHAITDPYHWLFLWSIFEGVPKFYRDVFEQHVLRSEPNYRRETLQALFFQGSSPLRDEADNWFLHELRGRYDFILKTLATQGPIAHGELQTAYSDDNPNDNNLSQYLTALIEKYRMVERRMPIFATGKSRKARYAITDNFLAAWLAAISRGVRMARFRPTAEAVSRAVQLLTSYEGMAFEKLIRMLIVECSQKGVGDFALSDLVRGYWNKSDGSDIEIDVIAFDEDGRRVRFGSCKRSADRHDAQSVHAFQSHVDRFRTTKEGRKFTGWTLEMAVYAPFFTDNDRSILGRQGLICHDLEDFANWLRPHRPPIARADH